MLDFIIKYWVQFFLGLIVTGLSWFCRKFYKLYKDEQDNTKSKEHDDLVNEIKTIMEQKDEALLEEIKMNREQSTIINTEIASIRKTIGHLTDGVLSVQGRQFKNSCRYALAPGNIVTIEDYEQLITDHDAYNALGGNHDGDSLFSLVQKKYESTLINH